MVVNSEQIKESVDILDVLSHLGVKINSRGKGACPVHNGDDDNFSIRGNICRCFSHCNQTWDAAGITMELRDCTYPEALEYLAGIAGVQIEYSTSRKETIDADRARRSRVKEMHLANQLVSQLYADNLLTNHDDTAVSDLDGRSFSSETLRTFGVGMAEDSVLVEFAKEKNISLDVLFSLGLIKKSKFNQNDYYDFFRNRIIFPIKDQRGNVAGFAGRKKRNDVSDSAKYMNSMESLTYKKKKTLYGIHESSKRIREKGFAYLVEGYTDVLSLHSHNIQNAVATCGTAFTIEMAQLLKRYTDKVIICMDGDEAGQEASENALPFLLEAGIQVYNLVLPDGLDPDEFLRESGVEAFKDQADNNKVDAVQHFVLDGFDGDDIHDKEMRFQKASYLLSLIQSEVLREFYVKIFTARKYFGAMKKRFEDNIDSKLSDDESKKFDLTPVQQQDIMKYGMYEDEKYYYRLATLQGKGTQMSNFIIKPIMLIRDQGQIGSYRLFEIKNEYGEKELIKAESDSFVELGQFKKVIEGKGNYMFIGQVGDFMCVKAKVYKNMDTCHPIYTLGYHPAGFYAWGNGIFHSEYGFRKVNEYGIVKHGDHKFFLPAFSKVSDMGFAPDGSSFLFERSFVYVEKPTFSYKEFSDIIMNVYGDNGMIFQAYYAAALFRDIIFPIDNVFPLLNLFGPPGSGKSAFAWTMIKMFGKMSVVFNLMQNTNTAFYRKLSQAVNSIVWFDEYRNDIHEKRREGLKGAYDGSGYEKATKSYSNETVHNPVTSAVVFSGQQQPTEDIALFQRSIALSFDIAKGDNRFDELKKRQSTGEFSQITSWMQQFRNVVQAEFAQRFSDEKDFMKRLTKDNVKIIDRYVLNYSVLVAIVGVLKDAGVDFTFSVSELRDYCYKLMTIQSAAISSEDETSQFWQIINYLINDHQLRNEEDYFVKATNSLTVHNSEMKSDKVQFDSQKIFFLRMSRAHSLYLKEMKMQHSKKGFGQSELAKYFDQKDNYIGWTRAVKFPTGKTVSAYAFKLSNIPVDIPSDQDDEPMDMTKHIKDVAAKERMNTIEFNDPDSDGKDPF